ncbi:hypothetical protein ACP70R_012281 [Stipagrostis hirtigluma subsp. patula]
MTLETNRNKAFPVLIGKACKDVFAGKSNPDVLSPQMSRLGSVIPKLLPKQTYCGSYPNLGNSENNDLNEPLKPDKSTYATAQNSQSIGECMHGPTAEFKNQYNILDQGTKVGRMVGVDECISYMHSHPETLL